MANLVEISGNLSVDTDIITAFGYRIGDIVVERSMEGVEIDGSTLEHGCAVVATDAGLHPVAAEQVLGYMFKGSKVRGPYTIFAPSEENMDVIKTDFTDRLRQAPKGTYLLFRSLGMIGL